jgi:transcriptional regulator with XRE-family HTH domain
MMSNQSRSQIEPLSARIFRLRIARGYSIYELAIAADVFAGTVRRLESGKHVDKRIAGSDDREWDSAGACTIVHDRRHAAGRDAEDEAVVEPGAGHGR